MGGVNILLPSKYEGILLQMCRNRHGRCIARLLQSIGFRVDVTLLREEDERKRWRRRRRRRRRRERGGRRRRRRRA